MLTNIVVAAPALAISVNGGQTELTWASNSVNFQLEYTASLTSPVTWYPVTTGITTNGPNIYLIVTPEMAAGSRFYCLHYP
jgi:hypothetical protein